MYCSKCGAENLEEAQYCKNCGFNHGSNRHGDKKNRKPWIIGGIVLFLVIISFFLGLSFYNQEKNEEARIQIEKERIQTEDERSRKELAEKEIQRQKMIIDSLSDLEKQKKLQESQSTVVQKTTVENTPQNQGYFVDERDGRKYKWVKIGDQVWMAENLAYKPKRGHFHAYNDDLGYVDRFGYLYDWETAQQVVIQGWHMPTPDEWDKLIKNLKCQEGKELYDKLRVGGSSGFTALTSGKYTSLIGFFGFGKYACFWTTNEPQDEEPINYYFSFHSDKSYANISENGCEGEFYSVRLIKD